MPYLLINLWLNIYRRLVILPKLCWEKRKREKLAGRVPRGAPEKLRDLLTIRCLERRWLLWFIAEEENGNGLLPYGVVQYGDEFQGARSLFKLGLLNRTGDNDSALVFFHKDLSKIYYSAITESHLSKEIAEEKKYIKNHGRESLKEDLPRYAIESYFRRTSRTT